MREAGLSLLTMTTISADAGRAAAARASEEGGQDFFHGHAP
jgi:hypothetical protein